ncbi:hypothetical protein WICANDRAFT_101214 [Wickerhamomyces anomalus NRRL Y-366-8]|uniref:Sugar phosphate transporter domain-containing protein n=1 Tax=Wickerhamomyces anomalus (strain ATCC 58044 / CBS 1984 / NCYC 433 / NRRL Y-366-8) TaxID=683960 RepID=A0A1E3P286_WICAA|nr:uncharacterized protein WICANDRAFT_101214 [Wickerhamomyces anomalus NRRL Y-366-8]ODQ59438.1 hypothetical protein WICANDRAFT_101214 [Wickerhamomyces anomalus NRRL Y-366-8]
MITVQINTPNSNQTASFEQATLSNRLKGSFPNLRNLLPTPSKPHKFQAVLPPIDLKIIIYCSIWYTFSAISSNIAKDILREFPHPTTFTELQFLISTVFCISTLFIINNNRSIIDKFPLGTFPTKDQFKLQHSTWNLIQPTEKIIKTTFAMGIFQFIGHITSHKATHIIPVSLVHSVKALSPLTTVFVYRALFNVNYPIVTYFTLLPLITGVILTCFSNKSSKSNVDFNKGLTYAFISMIIFVSQNIFAKNILTITPKSLPTINKQQEGKPQEDDAKIDKITILLYCSIIGFILTLPIYLISEYSNPIFTLFELNPSIMFKLFLHGSSHFCQAMLAFHLLGLISPVNYSIANILKRIVVIAMAIVWEGQSVNKFQGMGLLLTLVGLYSYDRWGIQKKK